LDVLSYFVLILLFVIKTSISCLVLLTYNIAPEGPVAPTAPEPPTYELHLNYLLIMNLGNPPPPEW
jgi:hypothetical protein